MTRSRCEVVTLGEALAVFNSPPQVPLERAASVEATFAGAEANVAIGLARLGHSVRWLSVLGDDPFGRRIVRALGGEGVDVSQVRWSSAAPTAVMFKCRSEPHEPAVHYYRAGSAMSRAGPDEFPPGAWREARVLFLTGITPALSDGCRALVERVMADARANGIEVWFDPNFRPKLWSEEEARRTLGGLVPGVDCLLAGRAEAEMLTGETEVDRIAGSLRRQGPNHVVIRTSSRDAVAFRNGEAATVPAFRLGRLVDPVGAGDAFTAGYLSAWLEERPPGDGLRRGHAAAAIVCQTNGDWEGLPTESEIQAFLGREGAPGG
jgi:2-dehydro-3-deoxygluconokinase